MTSSPVPVPVIGPSRSPLALLVLAACTASAPLPADEAVDAARPPTVSYLANLTLPGHRHAIDAYVPSNAVRVVVFLHGGGGSKEGGAQREIGIATAPTPPATAPVPDAAWLLENRVAFIVPQGLAVPGAERAPTWDNYVMTSGVDDVGFLGALSVALRGGRFDPRIPAMPHVYLAGHSNGGMMANRMWCEAPTAFDAYASLAGPASVQLSPSTGPSDPLTGAHPCAPSVTRPYLGIVGSGDTIIQTAGAWDAATWSINRCLQSGSGAAFVDPNLLNEESFHRLVRVPKTCGGTPSAPTTTGALTQWSDCGGKLRLTRVAGAEHCVLAGSLPCLGNKVGVGECGNSLEAVAATPIRDLVVRFFVAME